MASEVSDSRMTVAPFSCVQPAGSRNQRPPVCTSVRRPAAVAERETLSCGVERRQGHAGTGDL